MTENIDRISEPNQFKLGNLIFLIRFSKTNKKFRKFVKFCIDLFKIQFSKNVQIFKDIFKLFAPKQVFGFLGDFS